MKVTIGNMTFESNEADSLEVQSEQLKAFLESAERVEAERAKSVPAPLMPQPWMLPPGYPNYPWLGPWCNASSSAVQR